MESDLFQNRQSQAQSQQQQEQQQQQQTNPGLMRYRSAPSSYFTNLLDRDFYDEFLQQPSSPETERILRGLMPGNFRSRDEMGSSQSELLGTGKCKAEIFQQQPKQEQEPHQCNYSASASSSHNYYHSSSHTLLPSQSMEYRAVSSMGSGSTTAGLLRQSSSPAGLLLSNLNTTEGYGALRGMGSFGTSPRDASYSPTTRFGNPMNYLSARQPSSSGQMSPIAEIGNKNAGKCVNSSEGGGFDEGHGNNYDTDFLVGSWDDSGINAPEAEGRGGPPTFLVHHSSLPKSSSEIERLLQIQDSVPCKIRAKRGFATHPRSIAERVRRTKISERIRKLQDLVPNMDKQTNTSEMLDLAVEYIKDLQEQVKTLSDSKSKCVCSNRQMQ